MEDYLILLNIKNFGPVEQAEITFNKYTVLIGEQGSGKSTIAKLISLFSWLEKALMRNIVTVKYLTQYSRFKNNYCAYHRLEHYFKKETEIDFNGLHYKFTYKEESLHIEQKETIDDYHVAKVMYVPAERNFLSSVEHTSKLKDLPPSLQTFLEEFDHAKRLLKDDYQFPFGSARFEYDALNDLSWVKDENYRVRLYEASSGYQSVLPLILVSKYLSELVQNQTLQKGLDQQAIKQINKEIEKIMNDSSLKVEIKYAMVRSVSSRFTYSHFINIVEELEQNLYPQSQRSTLYELLEYTNSLDLNRILLTTHSPYLINYMTLAVKAWQICHSYRLTDEEKERIYQLIPEKSLVNPDRLNIYELKDGQAYLLDHTDGIPSDDNALNNQLGCTNDYFDQLLEIEEGAMYEKR